MYLSRVYHGCGQPEALPPPFKDLKKTTVTKCAGVCSCKCGLSSASTRTQNVHSACTAGISLDSRHTLYAEV